MNNKILEHFLQATNEVFQMMFDIEFDFSTPMEAKSLHYDEGHICAEIALLGDIKGTITFKFNADTALDLVEIMCGMEIDEVDEFVKSALGKLQILSAETPLQHCLRKKSLRPGASADNNAE